MIISTSVVTKALSLWVALLGKQIGPLVMPRVVPLHLASFFLFNQHGGFGPHTFWRH
jgi:hypothetical protein